MSNRRTRTAAEVHTITSAAVPLGDDIDRRARRYLFQMGLRTVCFLAAVVTFGVVPAWASVAMIVGAVILPYVAVLLANAGRERPERPEDVLLQRQLASAAYAPESGSGPFTPPLDLPRPAAQSRAAAQAGPTTRDRPARTYEHRAPTAPPQDGPRHG